MKNPIFIHYHSTPAGEMLLGDWNGEICLVDWRYRKMRSVIDARIMNGLNAEFKKKETDQIKEAKKQLDEYFKKERQVFDIPLKMVGSPFQQSVWNELLRISYGKTETYSGLANRLGNLKAIRAVAAANGANAISIFIPCHRILGSKGELTGYAGGLAAKMFLLSIENVNQHAGQGRLFF